LGLIILSSSACAAMVDVAATNGAKADFPTEAVLDKPQRLRSELSVASSLPPDGSIPFKKLMHALLAISFGTIIECESLDPTAPWGLYWRVLWARGGSAIGTPGAWALCSTSWPHPPPGYGAWLDAHHLLQP
jgi:hypothetical protein